MDKLKFIDLFCGIGGFHQALKSFGGECVLASEIDPNAISVYSQNYGINANINIRDVVETDVPDHDVLCAGFPCQTFSKAGKREGFLDEIRGTLFFEVARILKAKHPKYILLENVKNLATHDNGNTYQVICKTLRDLGYRIPDKPLILSPHEFGIPQVRERIFIPGIYEPDNTDKSLFFNFNNLLSKSQNSIERILDYNETDNIYKISEHVEKVLTAWDEFYKGIDLKIIGFPVWADYFLNINSVINPDYPSRKKEFIEKNRKLYKRNKKFIDEWLEKWNYLKEFTATERKFEWQCGDKCSSVWEGIIQIRPSGIRVKKPDTFPALVALVQTPIIGKFKRKLSLKEAARLQSFPDDFIHDKHVQQAYKQFGNSVNVEVLKQVFNQLFNGKL